MRLKRIFYIFTLLGFVFSGCTTVTENINSNPAYANIYWGKTENNLKPTNYVTPFSKTISGDTIESWCYRVTKEGFYDSEIICRPEESSRFVNFELKRVELPVTLEDNKLGSPRTPSNIESVCKGLTVPNSYKVYLLISREFEPPEEIVQALKKNTTFALLEKNQDVKMVNDIESVGRDGVLLQIDIIRSFQGGLSKRIDIRYQIINNTTQEVMINAKDAVRSKLGYYKITIKLGQRIANNVNDLVNCFKKHKK